MVQLIAIGLIGVLVWYLYSTFRKEMAKVNEKLREEEHETPNQVRLEKDKDGIYRPKGGNNKQD